MIKHIFVSEIDRTNLSQLKTVQGPARDTVDYAKVVVHKPWGYEYLMFENDFVAIWILHLKKGEATSMHCHPRKKSSLIVLSGKVLASTLNEWFELTELGGLIYEAGVFHTTKALTDDVFVMEIETPPLKKDLVRLKDSYGREGKGYEGKKEMSRDLSRFKYVFFDLKTLKNQPQKPINNTLISFKVCSLDCLDKEIDRKKNKVYSVVEEKVIDNNDKSLFGVGSIFEADSLENHHGIRLFKNCLLLILERKKR